MPTVEFEGTQVECPEGAILRDALLAAGETPHNGRARQFNCRGHGTCGTCAVELADPDGGAPAVDDLSSREKRRLSFPPHSLDDGLRLACQTRVHGDLVVTKHGGFWGQHVDGE